MMDRKDLKPGGFYLFRLSVRGEYKPELRVRFDKDSYKEGDEITMTISLLIVLSFCFFDVVYSQHTVFQVGERRILLNR